MVFGYKSELIFPFINRLDAYVIMPNHFHGILFINDVGARFVFVFSTFCASPLRDVDSVQHKPQPLGMIIGSFKSAVTKRVHDLGLLNQEKIWQQNYYQHIICDERDYEKIYEYSESNSMKWSLDDENFNGKYSG